MNDPSRTPQAPWHALDAATGTHTEIGAIALVTEEAEEPKTPLELRIAQLGRYLVAGAQGTS